MIVKIPGAVADRWKTLQKTGCIGLFCFFLQTAALADTNVLLFPQIISQHEKNRTFTSDDLFPSVDLFINGNYGSYKFLTEYFLGENENHIERFQLGYNLGEETDFSIGRYHTPYGYWHTQYHHGNYLQTSLSRPAMDEFGADSGIIPSHMTGALLEGALSLGTGKINYSLAYGLGPEIKISEAGHHSGGGSPSLHDAEILELQVGEHENFSTIRFAYLPDEFADDQFGIFFMHGVIPAEGLQHDEVQFESAGFFSNIQWEKLRLLGAIYHIETVFRRGIVADEQGSFQSAYLQLEYQQNEWLNVFSRVEDSRNAAHDIYLETLSGFIPQRQMLGMRLDLWANHAIKVEFNRDHHEHNIENVLLLGWSAVFP